MDKPIKPTGAIANSPRDELERGIYRIARAAARAMQAEAIEWIKAEARDCGCAERIEAHVRRISPNGLGFDRMEPASVRALRAIMNELGMPGPGYPAPVANAWEIARAALADAGEEKP